ncbi:MAG TPA: Ig-like domain-containing protein [Terriglobales bacterium]|nr:Ig-like domain-containing protein [Terriglobales bacterium]
MRRFVALGAGVLLLLIMGTVFLGCGGGGAAASAVTSITLIPTEVSLNRGATAQITAQALGANNIVISTPALAYSSDNPAITVSNNGLICAGQWDANHINCYRCSNPLASNQCTAPPGPGPNDSNLLQLGTASITATATVNNQTLTSSAVVVTDHEPIDRVQIVPSPSNPSGCVSQAGVPNTAQFTAQAFSNDLAACQRITAACPPITDCRIPDGTQRLPDGTQPPGCTNTIGSINWAVSPAQVATPDATIHPATIPVTVTAASPGQGVVAASVGVGGGTTVTGSAPFATCAVASIHVHQQNTTPTPPDTATSFTAPIGATVSLAADVFDTKNVELTSTLALTWLSSQPALALVSPSTAQGATVEALAPGTASITAACLPPSCNVNFTPPRPIFSDDVVTANITATTVDSTVLVTTSTAPANSTSSNAIVPIDSATDSTTNSTTNKVGTAFTLPANVQVNSMVLTPMGNLAFLGTNCASGTTGPSGAACSGLLRFDPTVATVAAPVPTITGEVLATDGIRVVVSDPTNHQTLIVPSAGTSIEATLPIPNATAAAFAIDGSKIYIVAGSQLFIYSPTLPKMPPPSIVLSGAASTPSPGVAPQQVAFFATGAMAYVADSAGDDVIATCKDAIQSTVAVGGSPTHIAAIPNAGLVPLGTLIPAMVGANSPNIDEVDVDASSASGCSPMFTNSFTSHGFSNVVSDFKARQLIVTPDSKLAIILGDTCTTGTVAACTDASHQGVLVYDLGTKQTSLIPLAGGAKPLSGGVTPDSANLYVGASDQKVHRVDLKTLTDSQSPIAVVLCPSVTTGCNPDFVVIRPVATVATLTSIAVTPANPTISVGTTQQFTAKGTFSDNTTRDLTNFVTWSSSTPAVAVIGPTPSGTMPIITTPGLAQALTAGTTTISATSAGVSNTPPITLTVK